METASKTATFAVVPEDRWSERQRVARAAGLRDLRKRGMEGRGFDVEILHPREVKGGDSVPLAAVSIERDWKRAKNLDLANTARTLITQAYFLGSLDPALPSVLASIIEGRGLYEYGIGEFFLLYGKFEEKYGLFGGAKVRTKMAELLEGTREFFKEYTEHGKVHQYPLPYAVRNILAHAGNNPNVLDPNGNDLRTSIDLLKKWLGSGESCI